MSHWLYQSTFGKLSFRLLIVPCLLVAMCFSFTACESDSMAEAKGGTVVGAGVGGLALAAAGASPPAALLLGATGALVGGAIGNQLVDKPAQEAKYKKDVQLAADQARAAEYARAQAQQDIQEKQLYEQWKKERGIGTPQNVS